MGRDRQLGEFLSALCGSSTVVLGVGNTLKADDGLGPLLCQRLAGHLSATVIDAGTVPESYIQPIVRARPDNLLIVDAIDFGGSPGDMRVFRSEETGTFAFSTHALSLHLFVDVVRQGVDVEVHLLGVQPGCTELGRPVTEPVRKAIESLAEMFQETFPVKPLPR